MTQIICASAKAKDDVESFLQAYLKSLAEWLRIQ